MKFHIPRFWKKSKSVRKASQYSSFRTLFEKFRELLKCNDRVLELIADLNEKLSGEYVFDERYLEDTVNEFDDLVYKIIYNLNLISLKKHSSLYNAFERIRKDIRSEFRKNEIPDQGSLVLPLSNARLDQIKLTGSKMGTLGEIYSRLGLRIPPGFVITTIAYNKFILQQDIAQALSKMDNVPDTNSDPMMVSKEVCSAIVNAKIPKKVKKGIKREAEKLKRHGYDYFAVRSSAVGEDTELSYAGQYKSFLNVSPDKLEARYKDVICSLFSPEAIYYRSENGITHHETAMAVGVTAMVTPKVSGVMYTCDPEMADQDVILISASWGLARTVVDGSAGVDFYKLARYSPAINIIERRISKKNKKYIADPKLGEFEAPVQDELVNIPSLSEKELEKLVQIGTILESYFKKPQDIEWSIDTSGQINILQSRPLRIRTVTPVDPKIIANISDTHTKLIDKQGMIACRGIGAGKVMHVSSDSDFDKFQRGSVLVARSTSPKLSRLIPLAAAVITDIGTPTGHLATVSREFRVPTLVDTQSATAQLEEGAMVTVDAEEGVVYNGIVKDLLRFQMLMEQSFEDTREFRMLRRILNKISPLNLTDPLSNHFLPGYCRTYHDITRYCHEVVVKEMINLHLRGRKWGRISTYNVEIPLPLGLVAIDIGDGIIPNVSGNILKQDMICSLPMKTLLTGLCEEGVWRTDPVDIDFGGFMASLTRTSDTMVMDPQHSQNLAVISHDYMNLNLNLGYHFNMVDAIMSENRNSNYIYFRFLGGVTDSVRRERRAKFLRNVLTHYDFMVDLKNDLVVAKIRKIDKSMMEKRLIMIGKLIGYARQLDALMRSEEAIGDHTNRFIALSDDIRL